MITVGLYYEDYSLGAFAVFWSCAVSCESCALGSTHLVL